jgi:Domain of unknown function (DUF4336)
VLTHIADGLWVATAPLRYIAFQLGTRMSVVRLASGDLWIHSPIALTPELRAAVDALGQVRHIVAPNVYHHLYAAEWSRAYPDAALSGPRALGKKRKDLPLAATLEDAAGAPWATELEPVHIDGCMLDETVFVHPASRTLISADLTENFPSHPHWLTRMYLKASGNYGKVGWPRPLRLVYRDHAATRRSLESLLARDFDRVVIAHGDVVARDGKAAIRRTFEFLR